MEAENQPGQFEKTRQWPKGFEPDPATERGAVFAAYFAGMGFPKLIRAGDRRGEPRFDSKALVLELRPLSVGG